MKLYADKVYLDGQFRPASITVEDGVIAAVEEGRAKGAAELGAGMLTPGFIDLHTHGAAGVDVNAADEEGLRRIAAFFASQGVTAWHASVLTDTEEVTRRCLSAIRNVMRDGSGGARLMGAHLEGPFLAREYKGAMPESLLRTGDAAMLRGLEKDFPGVIRYITVSPEVPGVIDMIREIADEVVVAIGHSGATYDESMRAIDAGARCITHTFNAMRLFHQHEPAIMGAALESDCWCEAICDGRHLHPGTVRILLKCKGMQRVVAITDSIMAAGLPDGNYKLGVNDVVVKDGDAKLLNGVRAGSTLTLQQALQNLVRFTGKTAEEVLPLLTANPAEAMRLSGRQGVIAVGADADLTLLDDTLTARRVWSRGEEVYSA